MTADELPTIAISAGDPAGIGGEVLAKLLASGALDRLCRPVVVGARWALDDGAATAGVAVPDVPFVDVDVPRPPAFRFGAVSKECGTVAVRAVEHAARMTACGDAAAMVTCPINKEVRTRGRLRRRYRASGNPRAPHRREANRDDVDDAGPSRRPSVDAQVAARSRALRDTRNGARSTAADARHARALGHDGSRASPWPR